MIDRIKETHRLAKADHPLEIVFVRDARSAHWTFGSDAESLRTVDLDHHISKSGCVLDWLSFRTAERALRAKAWQVAIYDVGFISPVTPLRDAVHRLVCQSPGIGVDGIKDILVQSKIGASDSEILSVLMDGIVGDEFGDVYRQSLGRFWLNLPVKHEHNPSND